MKGFVRKNKKGVLISVVLLATLITTISLILIHSSNENKLRNLEESYMAQIEGIEVPEPIILEIEEESYDEDLVSTQILSLDSGISEIQSLLEKIGEDENLQKSPILNDLISLYEDKLELFKDMKADLLAQESNVKKEVAELKKARGKKEREEKEKKLAEEKAKKEKEEKERKKAEEEKALASKEQSSSESDSQSKSVSSSNNKSNSSGSKSSSSKKATSQNKNPSNKSADSKKEEPQKKPKQSYQKPSYGEMTRTNPYYDSNGNYKEGYPYEWEYGEYYYKWSEKDQYWSAWTRFGMGVTDKARWEDAVYESFPYPSKDGKKDGELTNTGPIWFYFGG